MPSSPIKQLARNYYKGLIARPEYLERRRELLNSLVAQDQSQQSAAVDHPHDTAPELKVRRSRKNWGVTIIVLLLLALFIWMFW